MVMADKKNNNNKKITSRNCLLYINISSPGNKIEEMRRTLIF